MEKPDVKRKKALIFTTVLFIVMSCNNTVKNNSNNTVNDSAQPSVDTVKTITIANGTQCFAYTGNKDTVFLTMTTKDSLATGQLMYRLYEKDASSGTIRGFLHGDTLLASYTFLSEGTRSVREVIFLKKGNVLQEGVGSMKEQNGRLIFSNKKDISFDSNILLESVDCNSFPAR